MEIQDQTEILHSENREWLQKLASYSNEINEMQTGIESVAASYTSHSVMSKVEHFQNQLIIQKHRINSLKHSIKNNEKIINTEHNEWADNDHATAKEKVLTFEKIIEDLRHELNSFLQQAM